MRLGIEIELVLGSDSHNISLGTLDRLPRWSRGECVLKSELLTIDCQDQTIMPVHGSPLKRSLFEEEQNDVSHLDLI
jgi:hypothetical protein